MAYWTSYDVIDRVNTNRLTRAIDRGDYKKAAAQAKHNYLVGVALFTILIPIVIGFILFLMWGFQNLAESGFNFTLESLVLNPFVQIPLVVGFFYCLANK